MNQLPMQPAPSPRGLSSARLAKMIFKAEVPEAYLRQLPAQSLYCVVKYNGLASSAELVEMAGVRQCRLLMDFDCWQKDELYEGNLWEWLSLTDASDGLQILQKVLKVIDLKLVALLIARYVTFIIQEEPSDDAEKSLRDQEYCRGLGWPSETV